MDAGKRSKISPRITLVVVREGAGIVRKENFSRR
jgi:hypothetical protein